jgi:hypothetical protein
MRHLFYFIAAALIITISSCDTFGHRVEGNGKIKSETRNVGNFKRIEVSDNIKLHIKQDAAYSLRIDADENLMEYIEVDGGGEELRIRTRNGFNLDPSKSIDVYVSAPSLDGLNASGASDVDSENTLSSSGTFDMDVSGASNVDIDVKAPKVRAGLSGASRAILRGETKDLVLNGSGASELRCFDMLSENTDVDVSGASNADVFASVSLKADASGASNVRYKGSPSVDQNTSGAGSVGKAD